MREESRPTELRFGEEAELLAPREDRVVLRLSRNIAATAREEFGIEDGQVLRGAALEGPVVFLESGLRFEADVLRGQKTGFFLDQRENRRIVETLAGGRRVLNLFSYSGGFSLYAARGGATGVCSVDISPRALEAAERNFGLNGDVPAVAACPRESAQADVFDWLRETSARRFDLIVLYPPALAKRASEREEAMRAYSRLLAGAMERLEPEWDAGGGVVFGANYGRGIFRSGAGGGAAVRARLRGMAHDAAWGGSSGRHLRKGSI